MTTRRLLFSILLSIFGLEQAFGADVTIGDPILLQEPEAAIQKFESWGRLSQVVSLTVPVTVRFTAIIDSSSEDTWCPSDNFDWGDGSTSSHTSDCASFAEAKANNLIGRGTRPFSQTHTYRSAGIYRFRFWTNQGEKRTYSSSQEISIGISGGIAEQ